MYFIWSLTIIQNIENALHKKILFKISGDQLYLDKEKVLILKECLIHLIQNASDHGIKKKGTIEINLTKGVDFIKIKVSDDGGGIDHNTVRRKALEKGLITEEELKDMTNQDILKFIFKSSFSTKESVTEYSGRGVGMDVVYSNIKSINGEITVESKINRGTLFTIKVPA